MRIILNGRGKEFHQPMNLKNLVNQFRKDTIRVVAEVNGTIVKSPEWETRMIKEGDKVELVNFVGGG